MTQSQFETILKRFDKLEQRMDVNEAFLKAVLKKLGVDVDAEAA